MQIAKYKIGDMFEGMNYSLTHTITAGDVDRFAEISGDVSPLHMSDAFAVGRGYPGRVVHGALLTGYISQLIGVHFPGENCLLQSLSVKFHAPCFIGDTLEIKASVAQVSLGANAVVLEVLVDNAREHLNIAKAKVQVAFSKQS